MYQDYILRMVQQFSTVLTRMLRLRKDGKPEEALALVKDQYGALVGLPDSLVYALSEDDLVALLQSQGRLEPERTLGLAELLREEAHIYDDLQRFDDSYPRYVKALRLYLEIAAQDDAFDGERVPGLDDAIEQLDGLDLPPSTAWMLADYLEDLGRLDEAENVVLAQLDLHEPGDAELDRAEAFYQRLAAKTDAELIVGGLTRDEVAEALRRLTEGD